MLTAGCLFFNSAEAQFLKKLKQKAEQVMSNQNGNDNNSIAYQGSVLGGAITHNQTGNNNFANSDQRNGLGLTATITQNGNFNQGITDQQGVANVATISQSGNSNYARQFQR